MHDSRNTPHPYTSIFGSNTVERFKKTIKHHLLSFQGRDPERAGNDDTYRALSFALRDMLMEKWINTQKTFYTQNKKRVYYLSLEFLVGRSLGNALINMGLMDEVTQALEQLGYDLEELREREEDAALGNGGLGRLAACFMDSIATMKIPAYGYGICYDYGIFHQKIIDGFQVESPDSWLRFGSPWMYERSAFVYPVNFYGRVSRALDENGNYQTTWVDTEVVMAMACDLLVPGFNNDHVINTRLWKARASRELDLAHFNIGDYIGSVNDKVRSETLSKVLYPSDDIREGQELRLKQQYFFVAATFCDIMRRFEKHNNDFNEFPHQVAVQLNDTHPAIAIPELMRLLLDKHGLTWEMAWDICVNTFGYTNHTLMPEALETWPVEMISRVLPRHMEIIFEINRRFLEEVARKYPGNKRKIRAMSIIGENDSRQVRMSNLAIIGSHSVNGVAALHTELLKKNLFSHFHEMYPDRINSKTNGITPRRWLLKCNPGLAALITEKIGSGFITDLDRLQELTPYADDPEFQRQWQLVKLANKQQLATLIKSTCGVTVTPESMFDIHVKRIHEYKRQLLNILHVIAFYHHLLSDPDEAIAARTVIFAGKAAPSYQRAKLIIKLITSVADIINRDPRIGNQLKVVFLPNYNVSLAERIIPAADLSEQISTAGTEASGTGNMKFSLNGALTVGTLDGANIEIREEVGAENIFIFGMKAEEVEYEKLHKSKIPGEIYKNNPVIHRVIDTIGNGTFSGGDTKIFKSIVEDLLSEHDQYLLLLDLESYLACQETIGRAYLDSATWTRKSILNVAHMGKFSSDRTIGEYAREIWGVEPG
jgi:starch phosphorylase